MQRRLLMISFAKLGISPHLAKADTLSVSLL